MAKITYGPNFVEYLPSEKEGAKEGESYRHDIDTDAIPDEAYDDAGTLIGGKKVGLSWWVYNLASQMASAEKAGLPWRDAQAVMAKYIQHIASTGRLTKPETERKESAPYIDQRMVEALEHTVCPTRQSALQTFSKYVTYGNDADAIASGKVLHRTKSQVRARVTTILSQQPAIKTAYDDLEGKYSAETEDLSEAVNLDENAS